MPRFGRLWRTMSYPTNPTAPKSTPAKVFIVSCISQTISRIQEIKINSK